MAEGVGLVAGGDLSAARTAFFIPRRVSRRLRRMAEGVGFEPTETRASPVFKTGAFNRSATPPEDLSLHVEDSPDGFGFQKKRCLL